MVRHAADAWGQFHQLNLNIEPPANLNYLLRSQNHLVSKVNSQQTRLGHLDACKSASTPLPTKTIPGRRVSHTYLQVRSAPLVAQSVKMVPLCLISMIVAPLGVTVPDEPVA